MCYRENDVVFKGWIRIHLQQRLLQKNNKKHVMLRKLTVIYKQIFAISVVSNTHRALMLWNSFYGAFAKKKKIRKYCYFEHNRANHVTYDGYKKEFIYKYIFTSNYLRRLLHVSEGVIRRKS